jgi:hypothetical protein
MRFLPNYQRECQSTLNIERTGKFQHLSGQIFKDSGRINGSFSTDAYVMLGSLFQVTVNTADRELHHLQQFMPLAQLRNPRTCRPAL